MAVLRDTGVQGGPGPVLGVGEGWGGCTPMATPAPWSLPGVLQGILLPLLCWSPGEPCPYLGSPHSLTPPAQVPPPSWGAAVPLWGPGGWMGPPLAQHPEAWGGGSGDSGARADPTGVRVGWG